MVHTRNTLCVCINNMFDRRKLGSWNGSKNEWLFLFQLFNRRESYFHPDFKEKWKCPDPSEFNIVFYQVFKIFFNFKHELNTPGNMIFLISFQNYSYFYFDSDFGYETNAFLDYGPTWVLVSSEFINSSKIPISKKQ